MIIIRLSYSLLSTDFVDKKLERMEERKLKMMDRDVCTSFPVGDDLDAVVAPCRHWAPPQRSRTVRSRL